MAENFKIVSHSRIVNLYDDDYGPWRALMVYASAYLNGEAQFSRREYHSVTARAEERGKRCRERLQKDIPRMRRIGRRNVEARGTYL